MVPISQVVGGSLHIGRANSFVVSASGILVRQEGWFGASQSVYATICRPHHDDIAPSGVAGWGAVQSQPTHRGGANGAANSRVSRRGLLGCPVPHHIADILGAVAPRDSQCMDAFQQHRKQQCVAAAALPVRLATVSIYSFFTWLILFYYDICHITVAGPLSAFTLILAIYVITTYSAVGRTIIYSGALSNERILQHDEEEELTGAELATALVDKAIVAKQGAIPVSQQYRIRYQEQLQILEEGGSLQLSDLMLTESQDGEGGGDLECGGGECGDDCNNTNSTCLGPLSSSGKED